MATAPARKASIRSSIWTTVAATAAAFLLVSLFAPAAGAAPAGRLFTGDFETGDLSQWQTCQSVVRNGPCTNYPAHYSMQVVTSPVRQGSYAGRFELRDGDVPNFGGGERAEVNIDVPLTGATEGADGWYQWSTQFGPNFPVQGWGAVLSQFHSGKGSPPVSMDTVGTNRWGLTLYGGTVVWSTPLNPGSWQDIKLHIRWSTKAATGYIELWHNNVQQTFTGTSCAIPQFPTRCASATLASKKGSYFKQGYYRDQAHTQTGVVYHDGFTSATTEAGLGPLS